MSVKGISLVKTTCVVLDFDGTLVYIESLEPPEQPLWAAVIALPEQPDTRKADSNVFTPGAIRAKKISPYATAAKTISGGDLSDKNREFIASLEDLRASKGPNFVFGKVEAPVTVKKVKPGEVDDPTGETLPRGKKSRAEKQGARRAKRAAAKVEAQGASGGMPVQDAAKPTGGGSSPRAPRASNGATVYTLVNEDLTAARASSQGHKYAEGNRFHRVVVALAGLPSKSGTFEDIISALVKDGGKVPTDPEKVTRRVLAQLQQSEFGSCIITAA